MPADPWRRLVRRMRALWNGGALDRELSEEIRQHIDLETEELARTKGIPLAEARRRALVAFGGVERFKEDHRDARGVRWLLELAQDLRYAVRGLRRSPAYSISALLLLSLGIGASTAVFSAVDAVLLSRLPYPNDHELIRVYQQNSPTNRWSMSVVDWRAIEENGRPFQAAGASRFLAVGVSGGRGEAERLTIAAATSGFFHAIGIRPAAGRELRREDEAPGAPGALLLTDAYAVRRFGSAAAALDKTLTLDGVAHTVVGVFPPGVLHLGGASAPIWQSLQLRPPTRRGPFGLRVIGRLAPGVTLESAQQELARLSERIYPIWASGFRDSTARLTPYPLRQTILGDAPRTLWMFASAVGLVLLIAVANVAGLALVRTMGRWREVTLRTVLGASRLRLARLLLTESLVLAGVGAALGILGSALGLQVLRVVGTGIPRLGEASLDFRAVAFAVVVALAAGLVVGAYPLAVVFRKDAAPALRDGTRTIGGRGTRSLRAGFAVAQFALALPLLAVAGLLLTSFVRLQRITPGFDPKPLLVASVGLPEGRYANQASIAAFWARALSAIRGIPGVESAGLSDMVPPDDNGSGNNNNFNLVDRPVPEGGAEPTAPWPSASNELFASLGVPLLEGRLFTPSDTAGAPPVVTVSRAWAEKYFPSGNALGKQLISGGCYSCPPTTVVGVVGDVKYQGLGQNADAVYNPLTAGWPLTLNLFVRTKGTPADYMGRVRAAIRSVDPEVPLDGIAPMEELIYGSIAQPRHWAALLGGFAAVALVLAGLGTFGMLSYSVSARRREIGVRMALGAGRGEVVRMVVRSGMALAGFGAALGLGLALIGTRWIANSLYDIAPADPVTLIAVTLLLLVVALVASWLPARRAAGTDPMEVIRPE
ncbi:MAG: FtsX-like permease family protein [Gemmatimonadales bacterium]|nr:FtsX-like permease family protein [Gemmatimonadales bacterium]